MDIANYTLTPFLTILFKSVILSYIKQAYDRKFDICKCKSEGYFSTRQFTIF